MKTHRYTRAISCIAMIAIAMGLTVSAHASLTPTDDTYVQRGPGGPFGSSNIMAVKHTYGTNSANSVNNDDRIALLGFDLSGQANTLTSATLSLYLTNGFQQDSTHNFTFSVYGINNGGGNEFFDEDTLTYSSFAYGSNTLHGSFDPTGLSNLGSFTTTGIGSISFSTAALLNFINADTNDRISLIIFRNSQRSNTFVGSAFASKENANSSFHPSLTLLPEPTIAAVPEPTSLALLGLGGLAFAATHRKQRAV